MSWVFPDVLLCDLTGIWKAVWSAHTFCWRQAYLQHVIWSSLLILGFLPLIWHWMDNYCPWSPLISFVKLYAIGQLFSNPCPLDLTVQLFLTDIYFLYVFLIRSNIDWQYLLSLNLLWKVLAFFFFLLPL